MAFINPPAHLPVWLRLGVWVARRIAGKDLLPARLLGWYPRAALSSGILEALIAHHEGRLDERLLKLVRLGVSFHVNCPFCMDMNAVGWEKLITPEELAALQGRTGLENVSSFSETERLAVAYARLVSSTPLAFPPEFIARLQGCFSEREIVILATTAAQVNYWARMIQALGCPPVGFNDLPPFFLAAGPGIGPAQTNQEP
ncbi:MAG: carboxymuconolactone decarboxylase family protein [Chloroflexota bacterium]